VIIYVAFGGLQLLRSGARCAEHTETDLGHHSVGGDGGTAVAVKPVADVLTRAQRRERVATVIGLAVLALGALVFDLDIGLTAMTVVGVLAVLSPQTAKVAVADISWGVVLLICGIVTYVGFLESVGTVDYIGHAIASVSSPLLAALVLLYVGSVVSAFASTTGILGALIPLAVPLLAAGELGAVAVVAALSISASVVDSSPFSTNGALVVANAPHGREAAVYRGLMVWGFGLVALTPLVTWAIFVLPGW
jgi:di/tricarboxylate transporter